MNYVRLEMKIYMIEKGVKWMEKEVYVNALNYLENCSDKDFDIKKWEKAIKKLKELIQKYSMLKEIHINTDNSLNNVMNDYDELFSEYEKLKLENKKLVDEIDKYKHEYYSECDLREHLEEKINNKWILITEQLPEPSLNSVIGYDELRKRCVFVQYYNNRWILGNDDPVKIIAWQPLPLQPKI